MPRSVTIATRGSKLALWQAEHIAAALRAASPGLEVGLLVVKTTGDKIQDAPLSQVGGKGLFVKEIEEAMLEGRADLAVHSMKDVPAELPPGLVLGAVPPREDAADMLLFCQADSLKALPQGAKVGTSSLRRQAQLRHLRPDLVMENLRGTGAPRLRQLGEGQDDAIVMAKAGMNRLGLEWEKTQELGPPVFLPAVGQGALGLEFREDDEFVADLAAMLDHRPSRVAVQAERGFLTGLEGGCQAPIAGHATVMGEEVRLEGLVADTAGRRIIRRRIRGLADRACELGLQLAAAGLDAGGRDILRELYQNS